ncbi:MAG: sulfite exporter TauE/SafE family protein [Clostridia bacterium]|nr:sulfite exporter TauE/SafE family protein [Clostridia bacterium]
MFYLILAGLISGIISGMGIGGGIILIPVLTIFLGFDQKVAQGITLLYFIPTAIFALIVHIKNKNIDFKTTIKVASTGVLSAGIGAFCIKYLSTPLLSKVFAIFLLTVGFYQIISGIKSIKSK